MDYETFLKKLSIIFKQCAVISQIDQTHILIENYKLNYMKRDYMIKRVLSIYSFIIDFHETPEQELANKCHFKSTENFA